MFPELLFVLGLVVVNALLSGSELALISLDRAQLATLDARGGGARAAARLARDHNRFLATIQIGITLAGFLASAVAAVSLAEPLYPLFEVFGDAGDTIAVVTVTVVLSFVTLVFGELVPKRLALQHPMAWAAAMGWVLHVLAVVATPVVWLLSVTTDLFVRLLGGGSERTDAADLLALRELVLATGGLADDQHQMLLGAVDIADRSIVGVMTPRPDVVSVSADATVAQARAEMSTSGFTRLPVVDDDGNLDGSPGIVVLQDLMSTDDGETVGDLVRTVPALPESLKVLPALRGMQRGRDAMAFVVDEFGGVEGIVTIEDLVEEVVGEIYDDVDAPVVGPRSIGGGRYLVPGRFPVHDLADHGVDVPEGEYATVAGVVIAALEAVPQVGERATVGRWDLEVARMSDNTVEWVRFVPRTGSEDGSDATS
ncbi:MAG: HlyC/CorC family transporter [Acidimicrobiia bacterium]|nr:HlyC/CorC family transporter [Acidimicrobiia bacterium]